LEARLGEEIVNEERFSAQFLGHYILAVRSHMLYTDQLLHGMMRLIGFEGNYKIRMSDSDTDFFRSCLSLYSDSKAGESEARAKAGQEEKDAAKLREELTKKAMERQKEKADTVAAVSALESEVRTAQTEYTQIHEGNFGPKGVSTTLRRIRNKYKVASPSEIDTLGEDDIAEQVAAASKANLDTLATQQKAKQAEVTQIRQKISSAAADQKMSLQLQADEIESEMSVAVLNTQRGNAETELETLKASIETENGYMAKMKSELSAVLSVLRSQSADAKRDAAAAEEEEETRRRDAERRREASEAESRLAKEEAARRELMDPQMAKYDMLEKNCLAHGRKFEDLEFPPSMSSIYIEPGKLTKGAEYPVNLWRRLSEYTDGCALSKNGFDPDDLRQGQIGDCWFISAMSVVATQEVHMPRIMIRHNEKAGIYAVRFQGRFDNLGRPKTVIIDDQIPHKDSRNPVFATSRDHSELWPALLEKAYAKLHGSYEAIVGGRVDDGICDLVGGIQGYDEFEKLGPACSDGTLWHKITSGLNAGYLFGAGSNSGSDSDTVRGVVQGHAYTVLAAENVVMHGEQVQLIKLRNPWGCTEWDGEWSDAWINSNASTAIKNRLHWAKEDDGMFWMKLPDFLLSFSTLYCVRIYGEGWNNKIIQSKWKGRTAAGCSNYRNLTANPQFHVTVTRPAHIIIILTQLDEGERDHTHIGATLHAYKGGRVERNIRKKLDTGSYSNLRTVTMEADRLEPNADGTPYTLCATTFGPGPFYKESTGDADPMNEGGFTMSVFCDDGDFQFEELVDPDGEPQGQDEDEDDAA